MCYTTTFLSVQIKWKLVSKQKIPHFIPFRFRYVLEFCPILGIFVLYTVVLVYYFDHSDFFGSDNDVGVDKLWLVQAFFRGQKILLSSYLLICTIPFKNLDFLGGLTLKLERAKLSVLLKHYWFDVTSCPGQGLTTSYPFHALLGRPCSQNSIYT